MELLHDRGLLFCISLAKFEGKDSESEILAHVANQEAFPSGGHIFNQLQVLMNESLKMGMDRTLQFHLFECHDLAATYSLVTRGSASALGHQFCPWCKTTKPESASVTATVDVTEFDNLSSIGRRWSMSENIIKVFPLFIFSIHIYCCMLFHFNLQV